MVRVKVEVKAQTNGSFWIIGIYFSHRNRPKWPFCYITGIFNVCPNIQQDIEVAEIQFKFKIHTRTRFVYIGSFGVIDLFMGSLTRILQFHLQYLEKLTIAWVKTVKSSQQRFLADRSACLRK